MTPSSSVFKIRPPIGLLRLSEAESRRQGPGGVSGATAASRAPSQLTPAHNQRHQKTGDPYFAAHSRLKQSERGRERREETKIVTNSFLERKKGE